MQKDPEECDEEDYKPKHVFVDGHWTIASTTVNSGGPYDKQTVERDTPFHLTTSTITF